MLGLQDVKSFTFSMLVEQLGLIDAIRYTWTLHNRVMIPGCNVPCPDCLEYLVVMRNYDYYLTPLGYNLAGLGSIFSICERRIIRVSNSGNLRPPRPPRRRRL